MLPQLFSVLVIFAAVLQAQAAPSVDYLKTECPEKNGPLPVRFVHPTDCNQFYTCDWGVPILQQCPPGMHFGWIGVCMLPQLARCADAQSGYQKTVPEVHLPTIPELHEEVAAAQPRSYDYVDPGQIQQDPRCLKNNPVHPHVFRHSKDCTRYYVCNWGLAIPMHCPLELAFNEVSKNCDFRSQVKGC